MQTFKKEERLFEKKIISELFLKGQSFYIPPFKILWIPSAFEGKYPAKIMISVPARVFKKAVDRNKLKRRIREAVRQNKNILYEPLQVSSKKIAVMIFFSGKIIIPFKEIEDKIILAFQRLACDDEETIK